ncbi:unnamed protein product [Symbiodinium microadriaticum]|nr:unnamed protein product [Symbiodinium microadriaticum]
MIYSVVLSGFFLGAGLVNAASDIADVASSARAVTHSPFRQPSSMSGKLQKITNVVADKKLTLSTTMRNEEFDGDSDSRQNLRSLKMKDNFAGFSYFSDSTCQSPTMIFGDLVNYCFDEESMETGNTRSFILKIAKKEHTFVELQYEGKGCRGVPIRVTDMFKSFFPDFTDNMDYGECFLDSNTGSYATANYWSSYPDFSQYSEGFYGFTYTADKCTVKEKDYMEFWYMRSIDEFPSGCVATDDGNSIYYTDCTGEGNINMDIFIGDTTCSSAVVATYPAFSYCEEGDDDGGDDDDDYTYVDSFENVYCVASP